MSVGRISTYTHSDKVTPNKGAAVVKVTCQTDFAAKTDEFILFANEVAKFSYAALILGKDALEWEQVIEPFPHLEESRLSLSKLLKETIAVEDIVILTL